MAQKNLRIIIEENQKFYNSIGRVKCKILNSYIHFTSEGRLHLIYKNNRKKRTEAEQRYKLRLFPLVIPALKNSTKIEDWRFQGKCGQSNDIQYYAITCEVGRKKPVNIRVIIKRTGDGQLNYHSVMEHRDHKKPRR